MRPVQLVLLLLDCATKTHQLLRHVLAGLSHHLLQLAGVALIPRLEERLTYPALTRPSRTSDPVHVILDREREGVVQHHLHVRYAQPASGDVRSDEDGTRPVLELRERVRPGSCPRGC